MDKKKKKKVIKSFISIAIMIVIILMLLKFDSILDGLQTGPDRANCPYSIEGNQNAALTIKYVDSPYCLWCWLEEPVLKKAVETKGELFVLEKYDIRYCNDIVMKYEFSGTPSFVFSLRNSTKEFTHWGFLSEEKLDDVICGLSGGCMN